MKRYKVTILMPHEREFEATDAQDAHNKVTKMMAASAEPGKNPAPKVHSIVEVEAPELINFGVVPE